MEPSGNANNVATHQRIGMHQPTTPTKEDQDEADEIVTRLKALRAPTLLQGTATQLIKVNKVAVFEAAKMPRKQFRSTQMAISTR